MVLSPTLEPHDMEYMLMIYLRPRRLGPAHARAQAAEGLAAYGAYHEALNKAGVLKSSARLRPATPPPRCGCKSGKTQVLDGPFIETREQLGGYFQIDVPDLDSALSWAARCPGAAHGVIEVRPVWADGRAVNGPRRWPARRLTPRVPPRRPRGAATAS